jgi:hypothetical protein
MLFGDACKIQSFVTHVTIHQTIHQRYGERSHKL